MLGMYSDGGKTDPLELRTLADWVVRQRLLTIPGVAQVFTMGGSRKQFQVLVNPEELLRFGVSLQQVKDAVVNSNENATGGYLDQQGPNELLVRALGRVQNVEDLEQVVVTIREGRPVMLTQVARIIAGGQVKRGDSAAYERAADSVDASGVNQPGEWSGGPSVVLTINKQPGADTRAVTDNVTRAIAELGPSLPKDLRVILCIRRSHLLIVPLRTSSKRCATVLFWSDHSGPVSDERPNDVYHFNRNSIVTRNHGIVFAAAGMSINTMTLGGLAVALGELVDDAIVDVENIFRRLKENRHAKKPKHPLLIVFQASTEVRNSIVFSTIIVCIVFIPLFALTGMEGRLFARWVWPISFRLRRHCWFR